MAKYSQEFKLKVIQYGLDHHCGRKRTAAQFSLHGSVVGKWMDIDAIFGEEGLKPKPKQTYTFEFKKEVVLSIIEQGLSITEALYRFKLREAGMVCTWLNQYRKHGIDGLKPRPRGRPKSMPKPKIPKTQLSESDRSKTRDELLEELEYLRAEVAFLKKRRALIQKQREQEQAEQQRRQD